MASITKTLTGQILGVSIGPNGQVFTSVEWVDPSASSPTPSASKTPSSPVRSRPLGRTQIKIEGDKVFANNVEVGSASTGTSVSATALADSVKSAVEALISSGKISL